MDKWDRGCHSWDIVGHWPWADVGKILGFKLKILDFDWFHHSIVISSMELAWEKLILCFSLSREKQFRVRQIRSMRDAIMHR